MKFRFPAVLLLSAAALVLPAPAQAAACSGTSGVTVIVDFDNGSIEERCAPGDPTSGYDALMKAGFSITYATGNGTGALCSIDQVPDRVCTSMPPTSAYWAYFHPKSGGGWSYSNTGGNAYNPKPGSVEGWHFRGSPTNPPGIDPPVAATPKPTPKPTAQPTSGATSESTVGSSAGASPSGTSTAPDASSSAGSTSVPTADANVTATDDVSSAPDEAATDGSVVEPPTKESNVISSSEDRSWIWGVVLVGLVGAAAGTIVVRRRRS